MKKIWHDDKTLKIIKKVIEEFTHPQSVVVDSYSGLGTIPVTAAKMGRRAVAAEVSLCYIRKTMYYRWKAKIGENMIIIPNSFLNHDINTNSVDAVITSPPTINGVDKYSKSKYAWENNPEGRQKSFELFLKEANRILKPRGVLITFIAPFDEDIYDKAFESLKREAHYIVLKELEIFERLPKKEKVFAETSV